MLKSRSISGSYSTPTPMASFPLLAMLPVLLARVGMSVAVSMDFVCPSPCTCSSDSEHIPPGLLVNCTARGLDQVPTGIPRATTTLILTCNWLKELRNNSFSGLDNLWELTLSRNFIKSIEEDAFVGLNNLYTLSLAENEIPLSPSAYHPRVFQPLVSLKNLHLNGNVEPRSRWLSCAKPLRPDGSRPSEVLPSRRRAMSFVPERRKSQAGEILLQLLEAQNVVDELDTDADLDMPGWHVSDDAASNAYTGLPAPTQAEVEDLSYPDDALSQLSSLRSLHMDGLPNKTLGPGFRRLGNLVSLSLSGKKGYCNLGTLSEDTFVNAPRMQYLNLSDCLIENVAPDTFGSLRDLHMLDVSFNQALGLDLLPRVVHGLTRTKITSLHLDAIVPSSSPGLRVTEQHLRFFSNLTSLRHVTARFNRLELFDVGVLCSSIPPHLSRVYLEANLFQLMPYINDMRCLQKLEELYVNGYNSYWMPSLTAPSSQGGQSCTAARCPRSHEEHEAGPEMRLPGMGNVHDVIHPNIDADGDKRQFDPAPNLKTFKSRQFGMFYKLKSIRVNPNNSLKNLDLSENHFPIWQGPVTGLEKLKSLRLTDTFTDWIGPEFFPSFPGLEELDISGNRLRGAFWYDRKGTILRGLRSLKNLTICRNNLGAVHNATLSDLHNLEYLNLCVNGIGSFDIDLSHMTRLRHLDLSLNGLHTLSPLVRDHLDSLAQRHNVTVLMIFNPIECICSNIDFLRWMKQTKVDFGTTYNYFCLQTDGSLKYMEDIMATIAELDRQCGSFVGVFVGATACCVVVVVLMAVALAYRFRWKLRYLYYASRLGLQRRSQQERQQHFHYDAFVSFASEDDDFVNGELRRRLEDEQGLRLCIHTRDFMPGQYIASNIVDSVQRSRRTLVVLTRALLDSDWCHYELQMALMEGAHTGRDVLLFLLYEHVPANELSRDMLANLQATVYLEFPHEEEDRDLFWGRLTQALTV